MMALLHIIAVDCGRKLHKLFVQACRVYVGVQISVTFKDDEISLLVDMFHSHLLFSLLFSLVLILIDLVMSAVNMEV